MNELSTVVGQVPWDQWSAALWFALAIGLMDRFDISLPRGDSIGVSGALVAAGAMVAGLFSSLRPVNGGIGFRAYWSWWTGILAPSRGPFVTRAAALASLWLLGPFWVGEAGAELPVHWLVGVPTVYLLAEVFAAQAYMAHESGRPFHRLLVGNYRRQGPLVAAQVSASVLATITYPDMKAWSLVLVVALLLLMRQSLALLLEIRENISDDRRGSG